MARARYEIRIGGDVTTAALEALEGPDITVGPPYTTITGLFDQAGLQGMIVKIKSLGLELIEIRRVRSVRRRQNH